MGLGAVKYERLIKLDEDSSVAKLLQWIPPKSRVLEFGPATGAMTRLLKSELDCEITAIEIDPEAADIVRPLCDRLIVGDLEQILAGNSLENELFDIILFADVLEHLTDPWTAIESAKRLLNNSGYILLSIPNISHASLLSELLQGRFNYQRDGLLDNTHLRFFTRESVRKMIEGAGLSAVAWERTSRSPDKTEFAVSFPKLSKTLQAILLQLPDATTYQFLAKLAPIERAEIEDTSDLQENMHIQSNCFAQLYYSKDGVFTEQSCEILLLDLNSTETKLKFSVPAGMRYFRLDPVDQKTSFSLERIELFEENQKSIWRWTSEQQALSSTSGIGNLYEAHVLKSSVFFPSNEDPQIKFEISEPLNNKATLEIEISLQPFQIISETITSYLKFQQLSDKQTELNEKLNIELNSVNNKLKESLFELDRSAEETQKLKEQLAESATQITVLSQNCSSLQSYLASTVQERDALSGLRVRVQHLEDLLQQIWTSKSWKLTKPVRATGLCLRAARGITRQISRKLLLELRNTLLQTKTGCDLLEKSGLLSIEDKYKAWTERQKILSPLPKLSDLSFQPKISIILPVYKTPLPWLREVIESVRSQSYPNWELCIADDKSDQPGIRSLLQSYKNEDARIKLVYRERNGHIADCSQSALTLAEGEFVALLDHDDRLHPEALLRVVEYLSAHPDTDFLYSNEDKINESGKYVEPAFKPEWSPEYFLSFMYTGHLAVYRRSLVEAVGGFISGTEGSQDYDLTLRVTAKTSKIGHIPHILYHWRAHPDSVALNLSSKEYAFSAAQQSLEKRVGERISSTAKVEPTDWKGIYSFYKKELPSFEIYDFQEVTSKPLAWLKSAVAALEFSKAEVLLLKHSAIDIAEVDLPLLISPLSLPGVLATSPLICSDSGKVLCAGYGLYRDKLLPLLSQASMQEAGFGARLAALHNVSFLPLDCLAVNRQLFLKILKSLSFSEGSSGKLISEIGLAAKSEKLRLAVAPVKAIVPKSANNICPQYQLSELNFRDPFLPQHVRPDGPFFRVCE